MYDLLGKVLIFSAGAAAGFLAAIWLEDDETVIDEASPDSDEPSLTT